MSVIIGDENKLGELILYISRKCATDPRFGAIKLNKILYFSDFYAFGNASTSITEVDYQHLINGPAPRRLRPVRDRLQSIGALALQHVVLKSGKTQTRTIALRTPDLTAFTGEEIALVDDVIDMLWDDDADSVSERTHRYVGWKMTQLGETIPYGSIFLSDEPLSSAEILRGQELANQLGLMA
ncbi:MAG: Panacea domain-containing protein [Acidobacteriaceae bacterium]